MYIKVCAQCLLLKWHAYETHYLVLPWLQAVMFRKLFLLPSSDYNEKYTQPDQIEGSYRWLRIPLRCLFFFNLKTETKPVSEFCAFKLRKDGGNVQFRCRSDISCLTDRKKACMRQCTCSWGPNTIERRERLTNCWVHSATQQHWGTHICIILALSLGTYKTRGVHLTEMRPAHMHYISLVTRYIQNQEWPHNNSTESRTYALY